MTEDITLGELGRRLATLEGRINEQFRNVNQRLDTLQYVPREVYNAEIKALRESVSEVKESNKWLLRTTIASLVFPVIVAIVIALVML